MITTGNKFVDEFLAKNEPAKCEVFIRRWMERNLQ